MLHGFQQNICGNNIMKKIYKICSYCEEVCDEKVMYDIRIEGIFMMIDVCLGCLFKLKSEMCP